MLAVLHSCQASAVVAALLLVYCHCSVALTAVLTAAGNQGWGLTQGREPACSEQPWGAGQRLMCTAAAAAAEIVAALLQSVVVLQSVQHQLLPSCVALRHPAEEELLCWETGRPSLPVMVCLELLHR